MLYHITYTEKGSKRVVTPHPIKFLQAIRTVRGLSDYKVNTQGDYSIEPAPGTAGQC
jgi:hypothetical protein